MELPPLAPPAIRCSRSWRTSATATAAACTRAATRSSSGWAIEKAPLVFVGEGPGADEDAQGIPFVGRAGQLLTQMIEGTAKKEGIEILRKDIYICNVVKCRPPENRKPEPDEMEICGQFLYRQLSAIRPKAICALGGIAARAAYRTQGRRHEDARKGARVAVSAPRATYVSVYRSPCDCGWYAEVA